MLILNVAFSTAMSSLLWAIDVKPTLDLSGTETMPDPNQHLRCTLFQRNHSFAVQVSSLSLSLTVSFLNHFITTSFSPASSLPSQMS